MQANQKLDRREKDNKHSAIEKRPAANVRLQQANASRREGQQSPQRQKAIPSLSSVASGRFK